MDGLKRIETESDSGVVFINPQHVTHIESNGAGYARVWFVNQSKIIIKGTVEDAERKIFRY